MNRRKVLKTLPAGRGVRAACAAAGLLALATLAPRALVLARQAATPVTSAAGNWPAYLGDQSRTSYSRLTQITKANVSRLDVAWTYDTGDRGEFQSNNLIVDGVLYTASPMRKVIALDAATGRELWKWDPAFERPGEAVGNRQRGVTYWKDPRARRRASSRRPGDTCTRSTRRRVRWRGSSRTTAHCTSGGTWISKGTPTCRCNLAPR